MSITLKDVVLFETNDLKIIVKTSICISLKIECAVKENYIFLDILSYL